MILFNRLKLVELFIWLNLVGFLVAPPPRTNLDVNTNSGNNQETDDINASVKDDSGDVKESDNDVDDAVTKDPVVVGSTWRSLWNSIMKAFGYGWATPSVEQAATASPTTTPTTTTTTTTVAEDSHSHGENYGNYRTAPREESSDTHSTTTTTTTSPPTAESNNINYRTARRRR